MIVVFTITCNRIDLTKKYLFELKKKAGVRFRHIIIDNGSTDGTVEYLSKLGYEIISFEENIGIHPAMIYAIDYIIKKYNPEYIVKYDNDCEIHTENILKHILNFYESGCKSRVVAPLDLQILPKQYPKKILEKKEHGFNIQYVGHVGGIFKVIPKLAAKTLITKGIDIKHGDLFRGRFWIQNGFDMIYLTDIKISHRGGGMQTKNYTL